MKTEKESELLVKMFEAMVRLLELSNSADPFEILDAIDNGIHILEDIIENASSEGFKNEAREKLQNLNKLRIEVLSIA